MKKILTLLLLFTGFVSFAQNTTVNNRIDAKDSLRLKDYWITGFQKDINFVSDSKVPTSLAVAKYVAAHMIDTTGTKFDTTAIYNALFNKKDKSDSNSTNGYATLYRNSLKIDSVNKRRDSVFIYRNGIATFAFRDSSKGLIRTTFGNNTDTSITFTGGFKLFSKGQNIWFTDAPPPAGTGFGIINMGSSAGISSSSALAINFGSSSGALSSGTGQFHAGYQAGFQDSANDAVAIGITTLQGNKGHDANAFGYEAGYLNTYHYVNLFGRSASADGDYQTVWSKGKNGSTPRNLRHDFSALTQDRKITWRDQGGTVAFLSDIPSVVTSTLQSVTDIGKTFTSGFQLKHSNGNIISELLNDGGLGYFDVRNNADASNKVSLSPASGLTAASAGYMSVYAPDQIYIARPPSTGYLTIKEVPSITGTSNLNLFWPNTRDSTANAYDTLATLKDVRRSSGGGLGLIGTTTGSNTTSAIVFPNNARVYSVTDNQYFGASAGVGNSGSFLNAIGTFAGNTNSGNHVNATGYLAGNGNSYSFVDLRGYNASADGNYQDVFSNGTANIRHDYSSITANRKFMYRDKGGVPAFMSDISDSLQALRDSSTTLVLDTNYIVKRGDTLTLKPKYQVYTAFISQGYQSSQTSGSLIVGKTYLISSLDGSDDFSNVGYVDATPFVATGTTPTDWSNGTTVYLFDPVVDVLDNTVGAIVWTYVSSGVYIGTLTGAFTNHKTWVSYETVDDNGSADVRMLRLDDNTIKILCVNGDGGLGSASIEIRVYN